MAAIGCTSNGIHELDAATAFGQGGSHELADSGAPKQGTAGAVAVPSASAGSHADGPAAGSSGGAGRGSAAGGSGAGDAAGTGVGAAGAAGGAAGSAGGAATRAAAGPPETIPLGYGKSTTGGGAATPIEAATLAALQSAIDAHSGTGGLVLRYTGSFDFSSISDPCVQHTLASQTLEIKDKSNLTIVGADGSAANFGIHVASASRNIIIRNMTIGLTPGGSASDMISLEGMSSGFPTDVWIDHNELFSSLADCPGAGDTAFDGMIDIKKGADNVTISYNYLHDHHKASLNGFSDDDTAVRHVTFHHNLFENIGSRLPLQRHGYSHMLNNYLSKVLTSGMNIRMQGYSLIEGNYFEKRAQPGYLPR